MAKEKEKKRTKGFDKERNAMGSFNISKLKRDFKKSQEEKQEKVIIYFFLKPLILLSFS